ncbi:2-oxoglutarate and iron-dependent oxygenase domain-containing protein [soil metagenome]
MTMTTVRTSAVQVIDVGPALAGEPGAADAVAAEIAEACERIGFLVLVGHGIPDSLIAGIAGTARRFFDLPVAEKAILDDATKGSRYVPFRSESVAASLDLVTPPDLKEAFSVYRADATQWPAEPEGFQEAWLAYWSAMEGLAQQLMGLFARALALPTGWFDSYIDHSTPSLWVSNYPAQEHEPEPGQLRAGAHSDYTTMTLLHVDQAPGGLQVERSPGEWEDVPFVPGSFVVNLGDLMARWTNDRWVSTMHRVANPPPGSGPAARRQSIVFFYKPNVDAVIGPIPTCVDDEHPARYAPVLAGDYMDEKGAKQDASHRSRGGS